MSATMTDKLPLPHAWEPILIPEDLPTDQHFNFVQAGSDIARVGRPPDGLAVAVHVHPTSPDRTLLRLTYFFLTRQVEKAARDRAAAAVEMLKAPLHSVIKDGRPEHASWMVAREVADKAQEQVAEAEKRLADLKAEYAAMLAAGNNPVRYAKPLAELTLEAGAHRDYAAKMAERESGARAELDQIVREERAELWRAAKARGLEQLAETRAKLRAEAEEFARRLAGQLLELDATEKLLAHETAH